MWRLITDTAAWICAGCGRTNDEDKSICWGCIRPRR